MYRDGDNLEDKNNEENKGDDGGKNKISYKDNEEVDKEKVVYCRI